MICQLSVKDLYVEIAKHLPLKALSAWACTCSQFNQVIPDNHLLRTSLKPCDFKAANAAFFLRHFHLVSLPTLLSFNFRLIPREKLGDISETEENRTSLRVAKLMASLKLLEKAIQKYPIKYLPTRCLRREEWAIIETEHPYRYLLEITQQPNLYIENISGDAEFKKKFSEIDEAKIMSDVRTKKAHETAAFVLAYDYIKLREQNPAVLQEVFTHVWSQYQVQHLWHPSMDRQRFPLEIFQGLCRSLTAQKIALGVVNNFIIDNEELKALIPVLKNRKIQQLTLTLTGDVRLETFKELEEVLFNAEFIKLNKDSLIKIEFFPSLAYNSDPNSSLIETKKAFLTFIKKMRETSTSWKAKFLQGNM